MRHLWQLLVLLGAEAIICACTPAAAQQPTDVISREFTAYVDQATYPPITDATTTEFTVYIGNQPLRPEVDAVSREFSVYVDGGASAGITDANSREFTVYLGNQPLRAQTDAISDEFTAFVDSATVDANNDVVSREFTAYFGNQPLRAQVDCVSPEFTVQFQIGCSGDFNADGFINSADMPYFVAALIDPHAPQAWRVIADINCDTKADGDDIHVFVNQLIMP